MLRAAKGQTPSKSSGYIDADSKVGTVVNQSSMAAVQGFNLPYMGIYSSSKAAVYSLSDCMRVELAPFDVRVRCRLIHCHLTSQIWTDTVSTGGHSRDRFRENRVLQQQRGRTDHQSAS